ncbi:MAG: AAA family ATPase, partial [Anaerolineae bacterium]
AAVILKAAGYKVADAVSAIGAAIQAQIATAGWPKSQGSSTASGSSAGSSATTASTAGTTPVVEPSAGTASTANNKRVQKPTPTLEQFGRDLTREAQENKLGPILFRETEMQLVMETLCRRTKRNPVLVGPAGVGKTAIAEGLALLVIADKVPEPLRGIRILALQPSTLVAGARYTGELEKRMQAIIAEASQDGVVLFIDELHSMVGAGGMAGTSDVASLLKPALARGQMACIAATTDDEYRRFIEPDSALERRFQPIRVNELTGAQTLVILHALRDGVFAQRSHIQISDVVLGWLVDFAQQFLRNRYFPDKGVDLLEQSVAYVITQSRTEVTQADAELVAQRMVGMPVTLEGGLSVLRERLLDQALLPSEDVTQLANRLDVSLRALDLYPSHPNAVLLLVGDATARASELAQAVAATLYGSSDRVVLLDFSRFVHPEDITMLIGSPPGYVGFGDALPLHRVAQIPWCVVLGMNIHLCHPVIRQVFIQALADGFLTDAQGKRIYLSDTIVILTAAIADRARRSIGFNESDEPHNLASREAALRELGPELLDRVDLVFERISGSDDARRRWLEKTLLADMAERYRRQGIQLVWDKTLLDWLLDQQENCRQQSDWERLVDQKLSPILVRHIPAERRETLLPLNVRAEGSEIIVEAAGAGA